MIGQRLVPWPHVASRPKLWTTINLHKSLINNVLPPPRILGSRGRARVGPVIPSNKAVRPARLPRLLALSAAAAVLLVLSAALPATALPPRPTGFAVSNGNGQVTLTWDAPAEDADIWHHEYRFKTTGDYNEWTKIDDSGVGKIHEDWVVVTGLTNDVAYTFQLRIVNIDGNGNGATAGPATPRSGVCGRTEQVRDAIVAGTADLRVSDCADVTRADLAGVMSLDFASVVIKSLQPGDFSGLTALKDLTLSGNELTSLPAGVFSDLTALKDLTLSDNELSSLPVGAFSGLTALTDLNLDLNELTSLPAGVFSGLTTLKDLRLVSNKLSSLPAGVFSGLTALTDLSLFRNKLTSLPAGVFSDLTALTFLNLESNELTSLPAGVFSGLTVLRALRLRYNKLSSLPAGVFSRLTALTDLRLSSNEFTSLPAGVFSGLTALTNLSLIGTKLSSLPAGVFSGLTALTSLYLRENTVDPLPLTVTLERNPDAVEIRAVVLTAAPFAVPLVVSVANGSLAGGAATITVPIGARESAWVGVTRTPGTAGAVTADIDLTPQPILPDKHDGYEFVKSASDLPLTVLDVPGAPAAPSVSAASSSSLTVMWSAPDDGGSAITDYDVQYRAGTSGDWSDGGHTGTATTATLTGLSASTSYQVQVRATNADGTGSWSDSGSGRTEDANAVPTFMSPPAFDAAENQTVAGTVAATDRDEEDSIEGYAITGGADRSFFSIDATSGELTFDAAPNYEDAKDLVSVDPANAAGNNQYVVVVTATSGAGTREKTATQTITVRVTDVDTEAPGKPGAPTVTPASVSKLTVNWSAPANAGPAITDYDVRYRAGNSGGWTDGNHSGAAVTATLMGLSENTSYQVQVRATNAEGTGAWSNAGSGTTDANAVPTFTSSATFDAAENQTSAGEVVATDSDTGDDITGYAITGGADRDFFSIGATSGALTFDAAPNYEDAKDQGSNNTYVVEVTATSGAGEREKTATQTITVRVTDVDTEAPGKPDAPDVEASSVSRLTVSWSAPSNAGPAITDYDVQYRAGNSGGWSDGNHDGTATTATLTGLSEDTSYQVQVRATNDEGTGAWSNAGSGTTDANAAPAFSSDDAFDAAENQTVAGTVLATDSDAGDSITGYAITGGADEAFFSIGATSGALTFNSAPNYEDAKDDGTNNDYVVEVQATSGMGEREKTATQTITVTVTDVGGEAPGKPAAPTVAPASVSRLTVNWSAPTNAGPAITDYDVQYRAGNSGDWSDGGHNGTATTATLTGLSENTSYQVQVRATNDEGTGAWSNAGSGTTDANAVPTFTSSATFDAAENQTSAGEVVATDSDADDDITGYAITGGADRAFFSIVPATGALTFDAAPNYEDAKDDGTNNTYVVEVTATSGMGERVKTATQTITVTVTDVSGEAPGKPDAPTVAPASVSRLTVNWSAPSNAGPAITDYDVQYRAGTSGDWSDAGHTDTATTATLTGLAENTSYQVQVRATNDEGIGAWSDAGSGKTDANAAPTFSSDAAFDAAENQTSVGTVQASDSDTEDDIEGYAITGGADRDFFSIGATSGELTFDAVPNFEDAKDIVSVDPANAAGNNQYVVVVTATSGAGEREKTTTQTITVTVTDVAGEAPGKPAAPTVTPASVSSLSVNWSAPANAGPAITDYDVQYREGTSGGWSDGGHAGTAITATLTGLAENTSYQVQVRATNDEGTGAWSEAGSGTTDANAAPTFSSDAAFDAAENQTSAGEVVATDSDAGDDITGYAITGGADMDFFSIEATDGALTFNSAPNYEDAKDQGSNNTYVVEVTATSGMGERVKTAEQTITVTVTDVSGEAPGKPGAPTVTTASVSSLTVNWSAPSNAGPAITDYDVQYREGTSGDWSDGNHAGTATTATLTGLAENTSYQVQVRAKNDEGTGAWSDAGSGKTDANAAPTFTSSAEFDAAENQTSAGEVVATDSDADDDITGYAITGGADMDFFSIGTTSGALTFDAVPNYEDAKDDGTNNTYVVEVTATSGMGERVKTATQTITVTVTDVSGEAPGKPDAPTVAPASVSRLTVNWSAPSNAGPAITDYDVQYREGTSGNWSDGGHAGTATTATLTGLSENTSYQVQVRATNDEGIGAWSDAGSGKTDANAAPAFSSDDAFDAAENQTAAGEVVAADSDSDDDITGYAITGGADRDFFSIGAMSGALTFDAAPNFEDAKDIVSVDPANAAGNNQYVVVVTATSGTGEREKTVTQTITVTVTDVSGEAPGKPDAPTVAPASVSRLTVNWSAPSNAGPAITDYDVQYRAGTSGDWSDGGHTGTATTATLTGLAENTSYQVQVRATNDEGIGAWSDAGSGTTDANAAPTFSSDAAFDAAENQTSVGTVQASDSDTEDDIEGYAITGGADRDFFSIGTTSGALTFDAVPNFEDAKDIVSVDPANAAGNNQYVVVVTATSGAGEREKTATQTITVTVTDVAGEAPGKPAAPTVTTASVSSLSVNWSAPANAGPAITDYDVQYRAGTSGDWSDGNHVGTALTATLTGLAENTSYQVQVRATNDEGTGAWSDAGSGKTDANAAPAFTSSATFDAAENQTSAGEVVATDSDADDDITGYAITGGADMDFFSIGATSGALTFDAAPNYEDAKDDGTNNTYVVEVTATSGAGERVKTATQTITVTVTDVSGEAPGKPAAPTVAPASVSRLTVNWSVPANAGPAITDYDYRHRTTSPQGTWTEVTGTTITTLSATIGSLAEDTSYDVQVRATNDEGTGAWSDSGSGTTDANAAPSFSSDAAFDAAENQTAAGTVVATDSDSDDDIEGYAITGGADRDLFEIGATDGALTFKSAPNFEDAQDQGTDNTYVVEVTATSGEGEREKTATQTITVTVTDVNTEAPGKPGAPTVAPASVTSLSVNWSAPANAGPAITDYDVQYRAGTSGDWSDGGHNGTATTATLTGLSENTSYQVQVRATNDEGTGDWSDAGTGSTDANAAPSFTSSATFNAAENQTSAGTVTATDSDLEDGIEDYAITGGADRSFFSIGATSGALTFDAAPNYEDAQDQDTNNQYVVTVEATSGTGERVKTATQTITVTVTDVAGEAPGKPDAPDVSAASVTSLTVTWSAPANAGPAITDYDVQYREGTSGSWSDGNHAGTATTATLTGLSENTSYQVQVRATNDEGTGAWSDSGSGKTDANAAPTFSSNTTFNAAENQTSVGTVRATDSDSDDDITGYAITGGVDQNLFSIVAASGALTFDAAPNYEDAKDDGTNNTYVVEVTATSGEGERVKTATQTITVTVTDVNTEAPGKPGAPTVAPASVTSLSVNWSVPSNAGPAITDYDVQYRAGNSGDWSDGNHAGTATTATLTGLSENTSYQVQVRATNDEGTGDWSDAGTGSTDANAAPSFTSSATFNAAENQTSAGTVTATDSDLEDGIEDYAITGGADRSFFSIGATSGALTFDAAPNYEDAQDQDTDNDYVVTVQATSGTGERVKTVTQTITVTVTDVGGEAPGKPDAPDVSAASVSSLTVSWSVPSNAGPAITDYDVQYREGTSGSWSDGGHDGAATTATLTGLAENTSYQVQVQATNDEGTGSWSDSGSGTTDANAAPTFSSNTTFNAAENQTSVGTVRATDSDSDDDITGYAITGGADQNLFSIGAASGALTFKTAPNYEDARDQGTNNTYVVEVTATSGTGEREKTVTQTITVTVTNEVGEAPGKPAAPTVTAASVSSLTVTWAAPANAGPAITDYDYRYRTTSPQGTWTEVTGTTITTLSATIGSLSESTSYDVQVRATNDEGTGAWSDAGSSATINQPSVIRAYWTDSKTKGSNEQQECASTEPFRAFWNPPKSNGSFKEAVEWEAEITPDNGASNVSFTIQDTGGDPKKPELTGTVQINGFSTVSIRVRGRFGDDGWGTWSPTTELFCMTSAAKKPLGLAPNVPNPFNPSTVISYRLATPGAVRLEIYNLLGQPVRTLVDQVQAAGAYWVRWDARDGRGAAVAAGVYLVRLHYPGGVQTQRLLYLK